MDDEVVEELIVVVFVLVATQADHAVLLFHGSGTVRLLLTVGLRRRHDPKSLLYENLGWLPGVAGYTGDWVGFLLRSHYHADLLVAYCSSSRSHGLDDSLKRNGILL